MANLQLFQAAGAERVRESNRQFQVRCKKTAGAETVFQTYPTAIDAYAIRDRLCSIGCPAIVVEVSA